MEDDRLVINRWLAGFAVYSNLSTDPSFNVRELHGLYPTYEQALATRDYLGDYFVHHLDLVQSSQPTKENNE